jgi:hypothetical protein
VLVGLVMVEAARPRVSFARGREDTEGAIAQITHTAANAQAPISRTHFVPCW